MSGKRPNILLVLTDQLRYPPSYESEELRQFRREQLAGEESLRENGVSFRRHYTMAAACAPSRASLLTGHYPSLHGVTQTDGLAKSADERRDVLARAGHGADARRLVPRRRLPDVLQGQVARLARPPRRRRTARATCSRSTTTATPIPENIAAYLEADLLDEWGFSEWVGPEPHGLGKHNTGTVKDPFTADETIALLERLDEEESDEPWLTVCSFLNPHDIALFGVIALAQGLRYRHRRQSRTSRRRRRTTRTCRRSPPASRATSTPGGRSLAPQPWIETHRKFYYQLQRTVDDADHARARRAAGERAPTRTRSWSSAPTTATCRAPTAGCTRSGTTPTRRRCVCRSSSPARCSPAARASSTSRPATPT